MPYGSLSIFARVVVTAVALFLVGTAEAETAGADQPQMFPAQAGWPAGTYASPAFTPDGRTMIVVYGTAAQRRVMISHRQGDTWTREEQRPVWHKRCAGLAAEGQRAGGMAGEHLTPALLQWLSTENQMAAENNSPLMLT
jgi:hypothetical protein